MSRMNAPAEVSRVDVLAVMGRHERMERNRWGQAHTPQQARDALECLRAAEEARASVAELIEREAKLREYIAAIKVQATEAPACDADRLRLVVMYCDDAARLTAEQEAKS